MLVVRERDLRDAVKVDLGLLALVQRGGRVPVRVRGRRDGAGEAWDDGGGGAAAGRGAVDVVPLVL